MARSTKDSIVAEVCLYGAQHVGHGWLARAADGRMAGDGEPREDRSLTSALWLALEAVESFGVKRGKVRVFEPTGRRVAEVEVNRGRAARPYFGDLKWGPAPVYTIDGEDLARAAGRTS